MKIDVSKLKQEISKLSKLEEDYESIYLTYYNRIVDVESEWNNIYEKRLLQNVEIEKKQMNLICNDLNDIKTLYSYICNKYSFCNKININLDKEEMIINEINNCINRLKRIRNLCNSVSTRDMDRYKIKALNDIKYKINMELEKMLTLRNNIHNMFNKVKEIENDIKVKVSEFSLCIINETDISECIEP